MKGGPARPEPFPWERVIGLALGVLRIAPEAFWRMTPRELALAFRAVFPPPPPALDRPGLDALTARFPDAPHPVRFKET